ncbi:NLPA lipoprotein (plasmid) [Deinococcus proteolyticus MRP]|uniref:NLPA lipoprotein n=1 Tax=Deinococcus proteolyticus (strain ATCC 35074 / DSM 20540 / JCM 6276 / NBRC 101906 / NCIMB 13154 / VKM Ac-1939 / CCM 2703 / MRP) TaxID=693977 RepID=F0RPV6_DEIPM|nr:MULTISPECIES: MetQ/NlpA family ABC transporter substrate-binding protein [Deinococcus]ADY27158.1 NLPA lipoprotein [Deinococcus proteolyticus MRP]MCY1704030.1 MetQ/NlpA family ABC transporter substrate-binding protein [Deinococcus sp. SL84]
MTLFPASSARSLPALTLTLLLAGCAAPETTETTSTSTTTTQTTTSQATTSGTATTDTASGAATGASAAAATPAAGGVLRVGANPVPHAEILEFVKPKLAAEGLDLQIVEFTDYVQPNVALGEGSIDLNYFQHQPYLDEFQADRPLGIVGGAKIHVEPLGLYSERYNDLSALPDGATIAISSDPSNSGRALKLLEKGGLLTVKPEAGISATVLDITENPKKLEFRELEPAQLPRSLADVDAAVINTNYALEADLNPLEDSLLLEDADSPYANFLAGKPEMLNDPRYNQLVQALQSEEVRQFILDKYKGAVVPAF